MAAAIAIGLSAAFRSELFELFTAISLKFNHLCLKSRALFSELDRCLFVDIAIVLQPTADVLLLRIVVRPMDDAAPIIVFILSAKMNGVAGF